MAIDIDVLKEIHPFFLELDFDVEELEELLRLFDDNEDTAFSIQDVQSELGFNIDEEDLYELCKDDILNEKAQHWYPTTNLSYAIKLLDKYGEEIDAAK